ncbi:MAG: HAMP domain-containing protein, partial [Acidobacteriaceae bacterium]|nr:HAMP domain-containing protein [Acidobacteriaceae bacterium]
EKVRLFALAVDQNSGRPLQQLVKEQAAAAHARATVVDSSGKVLADSEVNADEMENHAQQPEFVAALRGQMGISTRDSTSTGIPFLYVAAPIHDGAVRLAYPLASLDRLTDRVRRTILWTSALSFLLAIALSAWAARSLGRRLGRIVNFAERIAAGDLTARVAESSADEIGKMAAVLDTTADRLQQTFAELRSSQERLETVLQGMQEAVIAVDSERRAQWANSRMSALAVGGVRIGSSVVETVRDPDFLAAIDQALRTGKGGDIRVTSILPGRVFGVTTAPMPGGGAVAVLHDVTEIERVEKTRRDFIANVSHELRTPLTSIQGYAETLLDTAREGSERDFLQIIVKNAARMTRLTEDLLTLARVESGETSFKIHDVTTGELLDDAVESFRETAKSSGTALVVEDKATRVVRADPDAIHQVLTNLIENAFKYAAGSDRIVVGAQDHGDDVEFYVRDFGQGIQSEHLPRLFERFYRVDKARSRESGGTGLGLAIAKHIVRAHHGTIGAHSELNHGSRFYFTLPAVAVPVAMRQHQ